MSEIANHSVESTKFVDKLATQLEIYDKMWLKTKPTLFTSCYKVITETLKSWWTIGQLIGEIRDTSARDYFDAGFYEIGDHEYAKLDYEQINKELLQYVVKYTNKSADESLKKYQIEK